MNHPECSAVFFCPGCCSPQIVYPFVVHSLSHVRLFATPCTAAHHASLTFVISWSLLKLIPIESVMPSNHLILYRPLLLPSIFPSIRVYSSESALHIEWPKCWSFSISPPNECFVPCHYSYFPFTHVSLRPVLSKQCSVATPGGLCTIFHLTIYQIPECYTIAINIKTGKARLCSVASASLKNASIASIMRICYKKIKHITSWQLAFCETQNFPFLWSKFLKQHLKKCLSYLVHIHTWEVKIL